MGSLYHHFGSRDGIMLARYGRWLLALLDQIRDAAPLPAPSPRRVDAVIDTSLDWVQANPHAGRFVLADTAWCALVAERAWDDPAGGSFAAGSQAWITFRACSAGTEAARPPPGRRGQVPPSVRRED